MAKGVYPYFRAIKGKQGTELDDAKAVARQYSETKFSENPVLKVFLWFYRNYTAGQERLTPWLQKLRKEMKECEGFERFEEFEGFEGGEGFWRWLRKKSLPLMPIANALTFNCRAITLFIALMLGMPWLYWAAELTLFNALCIYMVRRHEAMCREAYCRLKGQVGR